MLCQLQMWKLGVKEITEAGKMAQWVKALAAELDNLSLTLSTHMVCAMANTYTQKQIFSSK